MKKRKNELAVFGVGIGIAMAVMAMLAVSSAAAMDIPAGKEAIVWLEPDLSNSGLYHHDVTVQLKVNTSVYLSCWADWIYFNTSCVNITSGVCGDTFTTDCEFHHWGNYIRTAGMDPDFCEQTTGEILLFTYTLQCNCTNMSACTSQLYHHPDHQEMGDCNIETVNTEWVHGNFSCTPPVSCDASGVEKNAFVSGENVSVKASGLEANTNYKIWIQDNPVNEGHTLTADNCTSCGGVNWSAIVTTDASGNLLATEIWKIPSGATPTHNQYDIVVDKQGVAGTGIFDRTEDGIDQFSEEGFVAPVPEMVTVALFGVGLLTLAGYVGLRRRERKEG